MRSSISLTEIMIKKLRALPIFFLLPLIVAGCTEVRRTNPERTATEQLLLSKAVDRAAAKLTVQLPAGTRIFVDDSHFEAYDQGYAIAALRDRFLESGLNMAEERTEADVVVEIRSGALSTAGNRTLVGIPSFSVPIPLAGDFTVPEISIFSKERRRGVAKMAFTAYWRRDGSLANRDDPAIGVSGYDNWEFMGLNWRTGDDGLQTPDLPAEPKKDAEKKTGAAAAAPE